MSSEFVRAVSRHMRSVILLHSLLAFAASALPAAAGDDPEKLLPAPSCGTGWSLDGKPALFDHNTLSDRIDGEAEIFFPYGFQLLAYGRYVQGEKALDLDVYRMGSTLDAFGMYSGYRPDEAEAVRTGTEGAATETQLFFYQDRYFVRLQSTGRGDTGKAPLVACAAAVSRLLPPGQGAPKEVGLLAVPEVEKGSVQYKATSLLGYDFFPRGLVADAVVGGEPARVFVYLAGTASEAAGALQSYRAYLEKSGGAVRSAGGSGNSTLSGLDPLYGNVVAEHAGRYVFGIVKVKDTATASTVIMKLTSRLGR